MVLALAVHTVASVTAKVPFSMIALLDHVRKKDLPPDMKCRQVFPTSGQRSTSLWDVADVEALQVWLDDFLEVDCTNEVYEVQEEFAFGISAELTRMRTTEKVTANTRATAAVMQERTRTVAAAATQQMTDLDAKFRVSEHAVNAMKTARGIAGHVANSKTASAIGKVGAKVYDNERVAAAATLLNDNLTFGWRKLGGLVRNGADAVTSVAPSRADGGQLFHPPQHTSASSATPLAASSLYKSARASAGLRYPQGADNAGIDLLGHVAEKWVDGATRPPSMGPTVPSSAPAPLPTGAASMPATNHTALSNQAGEQLFTLDDLEPEDGHGAKR